MKLYNKKSIATVSVLFFVLSLALPSVLFAATAPLLGTTSTYGIVSGTYTNSLNAGLETAIKGGVCYTTPPGTAPVSINGVTVTPLGQAVVPCPPATGVDQGLALSDLNSQACTSLGTNVTLDTIIVGTNPPGTFPPGCYSSSGTMDITLSTTVTLDATAPGGAGNVWIFRSGGALTTGANSIVALMNGASASNVFWAPNGAVNIGANSSSSPTPTFVGTVIADALGSTGISLGHFVNFLGRALAFGHTVTTDSNTITVPTTLRVIKLVVNGSGGTAIPANFSVHVKNAGVDVAGSPAPGAAAPGTLYTLSSGAYAVSEDPNPAYVQTFLVGDCDAGGNVTLLAGDDKVCTIINTDIPAPAPVVGGGAALTAAPLIGILKVPTPLSLTGSGPVTYNFTVWNVGGNLPLTNVTVNDDKCSPVTLLSGDSNNNGQLDPGENWRYSCTTTLSTTTTNTAIATGQANGQTAIATAIATVAVGVPGFPNTGFIPPLINIIKVPSRLTPFPFGGGQVMYTYTVTNPGAVPMQNVAVTDDKCSPVVRVSGDTNGNNLLDVGEAWVYGCQTNVPVSTRNVATVSGSANGFTAFGYAFATVYVSGAIIPQLPNTGFPPEGTNTMMLAGIFIIAAIVSSSLVLVLKKRKV